MEKLITQTLTTFKPTPTRKLMETCKVRSTRQVGVLSDAEYEFVKLLRAIEEKGRIALIEGQGWVRV